MKIRKAKRADVSKIVKLLNSAKELPGSSRDEFSKEFVKALVTNKNNFIFVCEIDNKIAGVFFGDIWSDRGTAFERGLVVSAEFKRKGVGISLRKHFEKFAWKKG